MPPVTSFAAWPIEPPFYAVCGAAFLYVLGARRRASARHGFREHGRAIAFAAGLLATVAAVDSPLDPLAERLFAAHMAQHVLLIAVAPPLVVLSAPWAELWRPLPLRLRRALAKAAVQSPKARPLRQLARAVSHPVCSWTLFSVNLLVWHLPAAYDLTLRSRAAHDLEHGLFFGTSLLFWAAVLDSAPFRARLTWLWRVAYVTAGMLVGWVLALVLAFATRPLYPAYAALSHRPGGLTALADQQVAAGVMWVPGSLAYTIAVIVFFYRWLGPEEPAERRRLGLAGGG